MTRPATPSKEIQRCADQAAQLLWDAGIRLADSHDLLAMDKASPLLRSEICALYRAAMGDDFEFLVTAEDWALKNPAAILEAASWREVANKLTDEVDACLWIMQRAEQREYAA